jgi:hypothetical protein
MFEDVLLSLIAEHESEAPAIEGDEEGMREAETMFGEAVPLERSLGRRGSVSSITAQTDQRSDDFPMETFKLTDGLASPEGMNADTFPAAGGVSASSNTSAF